VAGLIETKLKYFTCNRSLLSAIISIISTSPEAGSPSLSQPNPTHKPLATSSYAKTKPTYPSRNSCPHLKITNTKPASQSERKRKIIVRMSIHRSFILCRDPFHQKCKRANVKTQRRYSGIETFVSPLELAGQNDGGESNKKEKY